MPVRTHARTVANTNASASVSARVSSAVRSSSSFRTTFHLATCFLRLLAQLLFLSALLAQPVIANLANRIQDSTGHPITPTTRYGEEYSVTLSLFQSPTLNATTCYKFYYTNPPLLFASENPLWLFATVPLRSFENGNRGICGRCLKIRTIDGRFEVPVKVAGDCPSCVPDQIEVSVEAFRGLGVSQVGGFEGGSGGGVKEGEGVKVMEAVFMIVDCPAQGVDGVTWPWIPDRQF